jgi:hypothetical protein
VAEYILGCVKQPLQPNIWIVTAGCNFYSKDTGDGEGEIESCDIKLVEGK